MKRGIKVRERRSWLLTVANLLIVDDDSTIRTFLALALKADGHNILEAESGEACEFLVHRQKLDMILLDAQMPGMDGFTCCAHLKTTFGNRCPPIIMITGLTDRESVDHAFAVGARDYVTKPVHITVLKHRILQVLREQELIHHLASVNQQLAISNQDLQQLSRIDDLTRVANRRYFDEILLSEWHRLANLKQFVSLLICDIDHFKQYNDHYGHVKGDECLEAVAKLIARSATRSPDLTARYGGEEFVLILPDTDSAGAFQVAKRIHMNLKQANIPHQGLEPANVVTMSIGVSSVIPCSDMVPESLVKSADKALYQAKARGRNCTMLADFTPQL